MERKLLLVFIFSSPHGALRGWGYFVTMGAWRQSLELPCLHSPQKLGSRTLCLSIPGIPVVVENREFKVHVNQLYYVFK